MIYMCMDALVHVLHVHVLKGYCVYRGVCVGGGGVDAYLTEAITIYVGAYIPHYVQ